MPVKVTVKVCYCMNSNSAMMDRIGLVPILPIKITITISTILNFDGEFHGQRCGDVMYKLTFTRNIDILDPAYSAHFERGSLQFDVKTH